MILFGPTKIWEDGASSECMVARKYKVVCFTCISILMFVTTTLSSRLYTTNICRIKTLFRTATDCSELTLISKFSFDTNYGMS